MDIDIKTLALLLSLSNLLQTSALYVQFRVNKTRGGLGWWLLGSICCALGFTATYFRGSPGIAPITIVANNLLFIAGFAFFYLGVLSFFARRLPSRRLLAGCAAFALVSVYFGFFQDELAVRRVNLSLAIAVLSFLTARALFLHKTRSVRATANFLAFAFLCGSAFFLLRALSPLLATPAAGIYTASLTQSATFLFAFIFSTQWTLGFILLTNQRASDENSTAKERIELIFNTTPDAVLITRQQDGCVVGINDGFSALTGYSRAEVVGKSTLEINVWGDPADRRRLVAELAKKSSCENLEITFHRKDGTPRAGTVSARLFILNDAPHIISVTHDITERKRAEEALLESESRWKFAIEGTGDGVWDWDIGTDEAKYSRRWKEMLGYSEDDILPANSEWVQRIHPDDQHYVSQAMQAYLEGKSAIYVVEYRLRCKDESYKWILGRGMVVSRDADGEPLRMIGTHTDITDRKQAERALIHSEMKFRTLYDSTGDAVMLLDQQGFFDCNQATLSMFGHATQEQFYLQHPADLSPPLQPCGGDSLTLAAQHISRAMERGSDRFEWLHRRADSGHDFPAEVLLSAMKLDGKTILQATVRDITERKLAEQSLEESNRKLESLSITDGLTGIANRRRFDQVLTQEYARHTRSGAELSLILLDIDYFKLYNDHYGHLRGDQTLREIARLLDDGMIRPADLAARYGGEEFACILPETDRRGALLIAERIRQGIIELAIPHERSDVARFVTASLGVVTIRCSVFYTASEIVARADKLLYYAKSLGRNRVECREQAEPEQYASLLQLTWSDAFRSGNQLIDAQHQSLFQTANELLDAIITACPKKVVTSIVASLLHDVERHFQDEELLLLTIGFAGLRQHAEEHAKLLARGRELSLEFMEETLEVGDLLQFLVYDVVKRHMLGADLEFFPFAKHAVEAGQG